MHVTAYLVPVTAMPALRNWARGKDWSGRWMPEAPDIPNVLLGAYPDDPQWSAADGSIAHWDTHRGGPMPEGLTLTAARYGGTGTSRDASADAETTGWVPSRRLHDVLGLTHGADFAWNDASGTAIHDPSATSGGPATLAMRRDLLPQLTSAGLTLFWTVLIGNELNNTDPRLPPRQRVPVGERQRFLPLQRRHDQPDQRSRHPLCTRPETRAQAQMGPAQDRPLTISARRAQRARHGKDGSATYRAAAQGTRYRDPRVATDQAGQC